MSNTTKIWLIIATSLILIGCIIFAGVMIVLNWDFMKLSTNKYETNKYEINENFKGISINTDTSDIVFIPSEDENCSVICYEQKNVTHSVAVKEDTLAIDVVDTRKWYEYIGINFKSPEIKVCLPKTEYNALSVKGSTGDIEIPKEFKFKSVDISLSTGEVNFLASASGLIKIKTSTGKICAEKLSAEALELTASTGGITVSNVVCQDDININVSTGKTNLNNIECKSLVSSGSTGNIFLNNVISTEKFSIKRSTGNVKFDNSDATEIYVETNTGNVEGSLLTDKIFITKTGTGKVDVPQSAVGGKCDINTDTGHIKITINK